MTASPPANSAVPPPLQRPGGDWWEVFVVLCVAYAPSIYASYEFLARKSWLDPDYQTDLVWDYARVLLFSPINCVLVLYLLWRNGERFSAVGLVSIRWFRDPLAALGCFVALFLGQIVGEMFLFADHNGVDHLFLQAGSTNPYTAPFTSPGGLFLWVVTTCIAAFVEELVYRGYLIHRFELLLQSAWIGVFVAAVIFAMMHSYQGFEGVWQAWITGLIFGGLYFWMRRLWPLALAHSAYNLWITFP